MASPWQYPQSFRTIPSLILRVFVQPGSWEVLGLETRLSFGSMIADIMLPQRYLKS